MPHPLDVKYGLLNTKLELVGPKSADHKVGVFLGNLGVYVVGAWGRGWEGGGGEGGGGSLI